MNKARVFLLTVGMVLALASAPAAQTAKKECTEALNINELASRIEKGFKDQLQECAGKLTAAMATRALVATISKEGKKFDQNDLKAFNPCVMNGIKKKFSASAGNYAKPVEKFVQNILNATPVTDDDLDVDDFNFNANDLANELKKQAANDVCVTDEPYNEQPPQQAPPPQKKSPPPKQQKAPPTQQQQAYPPQYQQGYPPPQQGYPQQYQQGYPPPQQGYPQQYQQGYPPPQQSYPPQYQQGYPPPQQSYPPQYQQGYPPPQQGYPQQYQQEYQEYEEYEEYPPPQQKANQEQKADNPSKLYISPKYQLPIGMPVNWGGIALGFGWIWSDGSFFGLDYNFSKSDDSDDDNGALIGLGLSFGNSHDLPSRFHLAYGGALGFWYSRSQGNDYSSTVSYSFIAPFVKLRWRFLEVSYKLFLGIDAEPEATSGMYGAAAEDESNFGITMHELAIGFYFGGW